MPRFNKDHDMFFFKFIFNKQLKLHHVFIFYIKSKLNKKKHVQ